MFIWPFSAARAPVQDDSRIPRPMSKKRPRKAKVTVELVTAGYDNITRCAPWAQMDDHQEFTANQ